MPQFVAQQRRDASHEAVDAQATTAEQLLAASMDALDMCVQRKAAAAQYSAPLVVMSTLLTRCTGFDKTSDVIGNEGTRGESRSVEKCVDRALLVARGGKHVLFLVRDPKAVTKRLLFAATGAAGNAIDVLAEELLHRISFRQCRSVYELLQELDRVERSWQETQGRVDVQYVALGPLCDFFSGFETAAGITVTGAGLKRMLELAIKRLRGTTGVHVSVMAST
ncbi:unnamed protein product [Hyaloperonospora brassicae]|uniref:Uncharacterized protein n=1 Tax=Hyaloperonospora brassicae TaxID=162125 RepID=A0AAV0UDM8_HYABA|nr:unnamed protein product [Hyaloperonospora brassicae]